MNSNELFTKWYKSFLKSANANISDEAADAETELVKEHVDCEAYVQAVHANHCIFCNAPAELYAMTDVGRERDELSKEKLGGRRDAHILPLVLPICKKCRRNFFIAYTLPTLICTVLIIAALLLTTSASVRELMYSTNMFIPAAMRPFFFFVLVSALAILGCTALNRLFVAKLGTTFNPLKIKELSFLAENGWKRLYMNRQFKMVFANNPPEYMKEMDSFVEFLHNDDSSADDVQKTEDNEEQQ